MTSPTSPARYVLHLEVDVEDGLCEYSINVYPRYGTTPLHWVAQEEVTTFCFTWRDLADCIERHWKVAGGAENVHLTRPSPFVDFT